ncbi:hypothetical protein QBC41DRAFT_331479 [Cercophora samala]|uniref:Uncharacterized protein n=1 Tax=Cercophora samala TaxID=330535 RepID=A0AA39YX84_9PEZI|nr:hypothetical protein QBC41DRAFT_331479 [Cercophora samala]
MFNSTNERGLRRDNNNNAGINPNIPASQMPPTYGQSAASGPAPTTAGHHKHDILNKLDPGVDSTRDNQPLPPQHNNNNNIPAGTYGPHKSRIANALDPRVDSDLDSSRTHHQQQQQQTYPSHHQQHFSGGPAAGGATHPPTMHGGASGPLSSHPASGGTTTNNNIPEGTYGPHSSRLANTLDPRVDSDADRSRAVPAQHGYAGTSHNNHHNNNNNNNYVPEGTYGPHGTRAGNMMDPRVDSDRDRHNRGTMGTGGMAGSGVGNNNNLLPGPAPNTAGPHKSDLLNKLDPRVDSKGGMTF